MHAARGSSAARASLAVALQQRSGRMLSRSMLQLPASCRHFLQHQHAACGSHRCRRASPKLSPAAARRGVSVLAAAQQRSDQQPARPPEQAPPARVSSFRGLSGDDFRHPLDANNTRFLRLLPGLEMIVKAFMGSVAESVLYLENISSAIQVGPEQLPSLHRMLLEAAAILGIDPPELYVRQNPSPNAYTLAVSEPYQTSTTANVWFVAKFTAGRRPFIVVHSSLVELLTPEELRTVLAHELGHLKCEHGTVLTAANLAASGAVSLLPFISSSVESGLLRWLRAAELTCDRAALLVAQDPRIVISALMKLAGGSHSLAAELNVDAFLKQARSYDEASSSPLGFYLRNAQQAQLSHPLPVLRAREIDTWARSSQFRALIRNNQPQQAAPATTAEQKALVAG